MKPTVTRYSPVVEPHVGEDDMEPDLNGRWVRLEDYQKLLDAFHLATGSNPQDDTSF